MTNGIEEKVSGFDITGTHTHPSSLIKATPDDNDKDSATTIITGQSLNNKQMEKKLRRVSLPADAHRKSKFASWIQYNIPNTPCRNNSHASQASVRSSSSDPTPVSLPTPTTSPTSIDSPLLPMPIMNEHPPPRTTSLQSVAGSLSSTNTHDEQLATTSSPPFRSMTAPDHEKKKKRFLPLVSRIRLGPGDRSSKKTLNINPPEPPPQLLLSALHCNDQDVTDNNHTATTTSTASSSAYDFDLYSSATNTSMTSTSESPTSLYWTDTPGLRSSFPGEDTSNNNILSSATDDSSLRVRRRSSCPLISMCHLTNTQECVMLRSFCSTADSSITSKHMPPSHSTTSSSSILPVDQDVYDDDQQCVLSFSTMKPRSRPLRRRTSGKREKRALRAWHDTLVALLKAGQDDGTSSHSLPKDQMSNEKRERYALTRKFILREFYLTEVTFWNQLYYSKVMFFDPLQLSLDRHSTFTRPSDLDLFSNLPDLMQCSSQLIRSMAPFLDYSSPLNSKMSSPTSSSSSSSFTSAPPTPSASYQDFTSIHSSSSFSTQSTLFDQQQQKQQQQRRPLSHHDSFSTPTSSIPPSPTSSTSSSTVNVNSHHPNMLPIHLNDDTQTLPSPNDQLLLGKEICAMANQYVVFLRWALDYKVNRKKLDHRSQHNKGFATYQEKLSLRKETNQFYVHDYLIIPIQRITRYGLLLADLQKHTEKDHPDYPYISRARMILTSLAVAMNKAQQK